MKSIQKLKDCIEAEIKAASTIEDLKRVNKLLEELTNEFNKIMDDWRC